MASQLCRAELWHKFGAKEHWAKIEIPREGEAADEMVARVARRYPVEKVKQAKRRFDPKNILGSNLLDRLFQLHPV